MKKSVFRHAFDFTMLIAFGYFGVNREEIKALICLVVLVLMVLIEIGNDSAKNKNNL